MRVKRKHFLNCTSYSIFKLSTGGVSVVDNFLRIRQLTESGRKLHAICGNLLQQFNAIRWQHNKSTFLHMH